MPWRSSKVLVIGLRSLSSLPAGIEIVFSISDAFTTLPSSCWVCSGLLYAWNKLRTAGLIFMKRGIREFFEKLPSHLNFHWEWTVSTCNRSRYLTSALSVRVFPCQRLDSSERDCRWPCPQQRGPFHGICVTVTARKTAWRLAPRGCPTVVSPLGLFSSPLSVVLPSNDSHLFFGSDGVYFCTAVK